MEQTKAKTLVEIMIQYKDQQPIRFGHDGLIERCYPTTAVIDIVKEYKGQFVSKIAELETQNNELKEALLKIQEWQMDYVELARSTRVYQIAEQALKEETTQ